MSKVVSLADWNDGGWVWAIDYEDGREPTRYRTNREYEGLWVQVTNSIGDPEWKQQRGTLQRSYPDNRAKMIRRLFGEFHDVSAVDHAAPRRHGDTDVCGGCGEVIRLQTRLNDLPVEPTWRAGDGGSIVCGSGTDSHFPKVTG